MSSSNNNHPASPQSPSNRIGEGPNGVNLPVPGEALQHRFSVRQGSSVQVLHQKINAVIGSLMMLAGLGAKPE